MKRISLVLLALIALSLPAIAATEIPDPAGPLRITADAQTPNLVTLSWDPNTETDLAGYRIYRAPSSGGPYTRIGQIQVMAAPEFTGPALGNGTWFFVVTAYNTAGLESGYSNEVSKIIATPPAPPKNLRLTILQAIAKAFVWIGHLLWV